MSQRLSDTPPTRPRRSPHPYHPLTGMTIGEVVRVLCVTALRCSVVRTLCARSLTIRKQIVTRVTRVGFSVFFF